MIDLHLHTTASDGRSTPEALAAEAAAVGCRTIALTDHDTVAGLDATRRAAETAGLGFVDGIEITAVADERDIHILGYFFDPTSSRLARFLEAQRERRRERLVAMAERLRSIGAPVAIDDLISSASSGKSLGRPALAQLLVANGHARHVADAFDKFLAEGRPAYVTREGATPEAVITEIHEAGGLASIAHPGKLHDEQLVQQVADAGLDGVEVFHPDHKPSDVTRYLALAERARLLVTGGSDYHGPGSGRDTLGTVSLPEEAFEALADRARARRG